MFIEVLFIFPWGMILICSLALLALVTFLIVLKQGKEIEILSEILRVSKKSINENTIRKYDRCKSERLMKKSEEIRSYCSSYSGLTFQGKYGLNHFLLFYGEFTVTNKDGDKLLIIQPQLTLERKEYLLDEFLYNYKTFRQCK